MTGTFQQSSVGECYSTASPIYSLLESENCTLEQLLDEEDIIQECGLNDLLIKFLCDPDILRSVIDYITVMPDENAGDKRKYKYPYMCCELLASSIPDILDLLTEKDSDLLSRLFKFLDTNEQLNSVLSGYFRIAVSVLIQKKHFELVSFIQSNPCIIDRIMRHIGTHSIMELLIMLGQDDGANSDSEWLYELNLIPKLVSKLSSDQNSKVNNSASYALVDIIAKCSPSETSLLLAHLQSIESVRDIIKNVFSGNPSSLISGLNVLIALVHRNANALAAASNSDDQAESNSNDGSSSDVNSSVQNDSNSHNLTNDNSDEEAENSSNDEIVENLEKSSINDNEIRSFSERKNENQNILLETILSENNTTESGLPPPIEVVYDNLEQFEKLLSQPPDNEIKTQFGILKPPVGSVRMKIVELLVALLRSDYKIVYERIAVLNIIPLCIDLFFEYEWNNLLHGLVEHVIQMILSGNSTLLKTTLFKKARIIDKIYLAHERNDESKIRLGFMGHITRISNTIVNQALYDEVLDQFCSENLIQRDFCDNQLAAENDRLNIQLGGHRPNSSLVPLDDSEDDDFTSMGLSSHAKETVNDMILHKENDKDYAEACDNETEYIDELSKTDQNSNQSLSDQKNLTVKDQCSADFENDIDNSSQAIFNKNMDSAHEDVSQLFPIDSTTNENFGLADSKQSQTSSLTCSITNADTQKVDTIVSNVNSTILS